MVKLNMMLKKYQIVINNFIIIIIVDKIEEKNKNQIQNENGKVKIDFNQFMNIMTSNIIYTRQKFGNNTTLYESEISNVSCLICPMSYSNNK